jgi:Transglycosylase SLT domain
MRKAALTCILLSVAFGFSPGFAQPTVDWGGKPQGPDWSRFVQESIAADDNRLVSTIPQDIGRFCPSYERLATDKRREVWARLFSLLAFYESGYDPSLKFTESFNDAHGRRVISRGLLQISKESANGSRYKCRIDAEASLHDPRINLSCGTKIAAAWLSADGKISGRTSTGKWRGMARYWSPFRNETKRGKIASLLSATSDCR